MKNVTSVPQTREKDWNGHTVATAAGFVVQPDTLLMEILCNADNPATFSNRSRYVIKAAK